MTAAGSSPDARADLRPDLSHVDTWLFDLDNTLYPIDSAMGGLIDQKIRHYVMKVTGLPEGEAHVLQKRYLADHGLSLTGLIQDHGIDPDEFHAIFHDLPLESLAEDGALIAALARLPGRRLIFTNADGHHAERVLERLGIGGLFDDVFHIGSAELAPKPSALAFQRIMAAHVIDPKVTAFFEDAERNLAPAHALGMTTVLVGPHAATSTADFVDHRTDGLTYFLTQARLKDRP